MLLISQHINKQLARRADVSMADSDWAVECYENDELVSTQHTNTEDEAQDYAEDWVLANV